MKFTTTQAVAVFRARNFHLHGALLLALTGCGRAQVETNGGEETQNEAGTSDMPPAPEDMPPETVCNGVPVDLQSSRLHCGECDNVCLGSTLGDGGELDFPACIDGVCQPFWGACHDLVDVEAMTCADLCGDLGCVQEGCAGETAIIQRNVLDEDDLSGPCWASSIGAQLLDGDVCNTPLPESTAIGEGYADYVSCCCGPA